MFFKNIHQKDSALLELGKDILHSSRGVPPYQGAVDYQVGRKVTGRVNPAIVSFLQSTSQGRDSVS